jgi:hypothetical protein
MVNCESAKNITNENLETEKLIKTSIQQSAPKPEIEFSMLNAKNKKL